MANRVCTRFTDDDGLDIGCHLVTKEYLLEAYPDLVTWMKTPGLWIWGEGNAGRLGTNSEVDRSSPVQTVSGGTNWKKVSLGGNFGGGIKSDGTLWLWGCNQFGQLGDNTITNRLSPVQTVSGGNDWLQISLSPGPSAAIKTDGTLWLWGYGGNGQLGNNSLLHRSSPVQTVSGGTNWKQVSLGSSHTAAIKTDGSLWLWGQGGSGQLGTNTTTNQSSPVQTVSGGTGWKQVALGQFHTGAIKTDGTLWIWGCNLGGQLGTNDRTNRSSPVQTVSGGNNWRQVNLGIAHSAAIKTDGTLWFWGCNSSGQLGTDTTTSQSSPVQTISGGTNWRQVSLAITHSSAIKTDGTLWLWGAGTNGRLGDNTVISKSSPVQTVSGGASWRNIALGNQTSAAIRDEGEY